mmetsp:Transcript_25524/g.47938  ORF Transcript_25524/g.47938 Transcript_25524/m.47938 type:complete len:84 (-) Transcript_25524:2949-3200(-)
MQSTLLSEVAMLDKQTSKVESKRDNSEVAGITGEKGTSFVTFESVGEVTLAVARMVESPVLVERSPLAEAANTGEPGSLYRVT